jgi:rhamnulokinase
MPPVNRLTADRLQLEREVIMKKHLKMLAFDYGASSGRAILGVFDGGKLVLEEKYRFPNTPVMLHNSFYWDILRLFHEMKQGILKTSAEEGKTLRSIAVDTWGVDYGLLDKEGELLGNPFHYRDRRTDGMVESAGAILPQREIYERTGIQIQKFNTLYQLLALQKRRPELLERAERLLFIPDLFNYLLTGVSANEATIASTSQMIDPHSGTWDSGLLARFDIPGRLFSRPVKPGAVLGNTGPWIGAELNLESIPVVAAAGHDTADAVFSVPASRDDFAYLSSGTWSLLGIESARPLINDQTYKFNYTNEGGVFDTFRVLANIMGLWIYQECKRVWDVEPEALNFDELDQLAAAAPEFGALINPDDGRFYAPGHMPQKIVEFCRMTGQNDPAGKGGIVRCVMESLALKYRMAVEGLERIAGRELPVLHIVGGGCKNKVLCQLTADATGKPVLAGPVEATAIGNLLCQLIAHGEVRNLREARALAARSFPVAEYVPTASRAKWDEAYQRFSALTK